MGIVPVRVTDLGHRCAGPMGHTTDSVETRMERGLPVRTTGTRRLRRRFFQCLFPSRESADL